jgi:hypothetical protein
MILYGYTKVNNRTTVSSHCVNPRYFRLSMLIPLFRVAAIFFDNHPFIQLSLSCLTKAFGFRAFFEKGGDAMG